MLIQFFTMVTAINNDVHSISSQYPSIPHYKGLLEKNKMDKATVLSAFTTILVKNHEIVATIACAPEGTTPSEPYSVVAMQPNIEDVPDVSEMEFDTPIVNVAVVANPRDMCKPEGNDEFLVATGERARSPLDIATAFKDICDDTLLDAV